jgi:hypothetical protein
MFIIGLTILIMQNINYYCNYNNIGKDIIKSHYIMQEIENKTKFNNSKFHKETETESNYYFDKKLNYI